MQTRETPIRNGCATPIRAARRASALIAVITAAWLVCLPGCREIDGPADALSSDGDQGECIAPDRDEYKAEHGISPEDQGDDPEVDVEGMEHTVLFVFDKSGSMTATWDHRDKWTVARDAMVDSVAKYQHYLSAGAIFFPTDMDCDVAPIKGDAQIGYLRGGDFLDRWGMLQGEHDPVGQTPLNLALERADEAISLACDTGVLERPFKIVLMTDGEPNCDYDYEELLSYPQKWLEQGIETHVIGLPGSEDAELLLEQLATAGGTEVLLLSATDDPEQTEDDVEDFEEEVDIACE